MGLSDEFTDHKLYDRLSLTVKGDSPFSEILKSLSSTEHRHYEFWRKYAPDQEPKVSSLAISWVLLLRMLFGLTFAVRYLDRHEAKVVKRYKSVAHLIPESDRTSFDEMLKDEEEHEREFGRKIESSVIRYISFVVLGLADALVEITGIHAGSLGIYNITEYAGLAGIVAGAAASLAMASAAFAQAKQGFQGSARLSAAYTGISYFITAVILATPYFIFASMVYALTVSLLLAVLIITFVSYYSSIISGKPFTRDYLEILGIMFGVTLALYVFGYVVGITTGFRVS